MTATIKTQMDGKKHYAGFLFQYTFQITLCVMTLVKFHCFQLIDHIDMSYLKYSICVCRVYNFKK